jgi:hypothetical protein
VVTRLEMSRYVLVPGLARLGSTLMRPARSTTNSRLVSPGGVAKAMGAEKLSPGNAVSRVYVAAGLVGICRVVFETRVICPCAGPATRSRSAGRNRADLT